MIAAKYITRLVIWVNVYTLYVIHHTGIIQRPHDHLFQKSWHIDATLVHKLVSEQKSTNLSFVFMIVIKSIAIYVIWVNLFILNSMHSTGITQRPHDHLFQKSGHLDAHMRLWCKNW